MGVEFDKGEASVSLTILVSWFASPTQTTDQIVAPHVRNHEAVMHGYFTKCLGKPKAMLQG